MIKPSLILTLLFSSVILFACKHNEPTVSKGSHTDTTENVQQALPIAEPLSHCQINDATLGQGKVLDEAATNMIKEQTGANVVRVLKPGQPVTMDYRPQRVNITVDDEQKVVLITCG